MLDLRSIIFLSFSGFRAQIPYQSEFVLELYDNLDQAFLVYLRSVSCGELDSADLTHDLQMWQECAQILMLVHVFVPCQATPEMAVILLDISRLFATKVPGKIDSDVLQLLWKVYPLSLFSRFAKIMISLRILKKLVLPVICTKKSLFCILS